MFGNERSIVIRSFMVLLAATFVFSIAGTSRGNTSTGNDNSILGRVFLPSGNAAGGGIRVRLMSGRSRETRETTDSEGKFVFTDLENGSYAVSIDEETDYMPSTQQVEISVDRISPPQTFYVIFRLAARVKIGPKPQVIRTENIGIPKRALDHYDKAMELSNAGDNAGAIAELNLAVKEYPAFMLAHTELGVQYLKLNQLDKADEALKAALKIKPDAYEPLVNRGIALFRSKRFDEAANELRKALKTKEQSAVAHYYLGRSLLALKNYDDAEKEFNSSIAIGGDQMKEAHRMLASMFLDRQDYKRAVTELETYLRLAPAAPDADKLREVVRQLRSADPTLQKPQV